MGAPVGRSDRGWETSVGLVKLTKKGQELFGKDIMASLATNADCLA